MEWVGRESLIGEILNEEESKGMDMEGEGGKPSIGERELSTKASETVTNLNASNTHLVHL